jgi:hypothetical protein
VPREAIPVPVQHIRGNGKPPEEVR